MASVTDEGTFINTDDKNFSMSCEIGQNRRKLGHNYYPIYDIGYIPYLHFCEYPGPD